MTTKCTDYIGVTKGLRTWIDLLPEPEKEPASKIICKALLSDYFIEEIDTELHKKQTDNVSAALGIANMLEAMNSIPALNKAPLHIQIAMQSLVSNALEVIEYAQESVSNFDYTKTHTIKVKPRNCYILWRNYAQNILIKIDEINDSKLFSFELKITGTDLWKVVTTKFNSNILSKETCYNLVKRHKKSTQNIAQK